MTKTRTLSAPALGLVNTRDLETWLAHSRWWSGPAHPLNHGHKQLQQEADSSSNSTTASWLQARRLSAPSGNRGRRHPWSLDPLQVTSRRGRLMFMSESLTINPAHLSDEDWATLRAFLESARARGEVVDVSSRMELLSPADVAQRLGMSRTTVLRRIADGDLAATKVGTHHRIPLAEFERYSHELMRRMAEASATDIEAELFGG